jgi:hypothetical protein
MEIIKIKRGKKTRSVIKYKNNENGNKLRQLHKVILKKLQDIYNFSDNSYAYRKGFSTLDCAIQHKNSVSFLKIDIQKFFNSIKYLEFSNFLKKTLENFCVIDKDFKNLLKLCMYNNMLPLGLITSPILSDIYLHEFDKKIKNFLHEYDKNIIFTRYADDMFFSCKEEMNSNDINYITKLLDEELAKINLQINQEKTVVKNLRNVGDHVKILGINIVKTQAQNELTVGKKFIYDTCKMYLEFLKNIKSDKAKFYTGKRIAGRIAYIRQIEGKVGYEKFQERIYTATKHKVKVQDHIANLMYLMKSEIDSAG